MFKPSIFLPPFFALFFLASANGQQTSLLRGRITDEAGAPLTGTNIFLLDAQDSAFIKGAATGTGGMYELPGIAVGQYVIRVSEWL
ncbi:MAG: carboxypeptidase regulatory-like domain-containing protein [Lewinellaceae bacterium]|nr:carboxypeptidase regulatory-like domain-containing protein [Lewinellaceae bacterium]